MRDFLFYVRSFSPEQKKNKKKRGKKASVMRFLAHLGRMSPPWQRKDPIPNQRAFEIV